jgi:hypothetical protein
MVIEPVGGRSRHGSSRGYRAVLLVLRIGKRQNVAVCEGPALSRLVDDLAQVVCGEPTNAGANGSQTQVTLEYIVVRDGSTVRLVAGLAW